MKRISLRRMVAAPAAIGLVLTIPAPGATAQAVESWTVTAPANGVVATLARDTTAGTLTLAVSRQGRTLLSPAPVGIRTSTADLTRGLALAGSTSRLVSDQYTMTTGRQRSRASLMAETRFTFTGAGGARFDLLVRAAEDGVAYRYTLPTATTVLGEASAFTLPGSAAAWLLPYNPQYENNRVETTAAGAATGIFGYPSLFQVGDDYALLTESDVDGGYSGSRLRHDNGSTTYRVELADAQATSVTRTPWRTAIVGTLATVTESTLVDDLSAPARFQDTSWVRPGKVAWSWLSEHASPRDFERQKAYVDFAARNSWPYVLVDEGWSASWVPELTRYARAKGVDIILWFHWSGLDTAQKRQTTLPLVKSWGVAGVKIDFMESDTQARYRWYDDVLAHTARYQLMVNFHGSTIPHGLARTWPHVMSMEAVRGAENLPDPENNTVQPFTRNVAGSMDYTPVSLEVGTRKASIGHEMALAAVFESGWQHFADKPEAYDHFPNALRFLDQLPTVWDETRFVAGHPGDDTVLARRNGDRWFVGAIAAGGARTLRAPLGFLGNGQWLVDVSRDPVTPVRGDVVRSSSVLTRTATLAVDVPANGGFGAIICPATAGRTTCDGPIQQAPETSLTLAPTGTVDVARGPSIEVSGSFVVRSARTVRDVRFSPVLPSGWTLAGPPVTATVLTQGTTLTGRWRATANTTAPVGRVELPVVVEFTDPSLAPGRQRVHVESVVHAFVPPSGTVYLSDLPFESENNGWGSVERDRSNNDIPAGDGNPITIAGVTYAKGLGTHAASELTVYLGAHCTTFTASVGLDDETTSPGSVVFQVLDDGTLLRDTGVVRGDTAAVPLSVDVSGVRVLTLRVTDGGDGKNFDHADWAEAKITCG
jgi:hypothetical protein